MGDLDPMSAERLEAGRLAPQRAGHGPDQSDFLDEIQFGQRDRHPIGDDTEHALPLQHAGVCVGDLPARWS